jgi:hypothetical protein
MEPMPDFSAAHSMDTAWFAVDAQGHVGYFNTGEAGAMPQDAQRDPDLEQIPDVGGEDMPCREGTIPGYPGHHHLDWRYFHHNDAVVHVARLDVLPRRADLASRVEPIHGCFRVRGLTEKEFHQLHERGLCLSCGVVYAWRTPGRRGWGSKGLFIYDHLCENWASGPYGLSWRPTRPVHLDMLPPELRQTVRRVRLPVRFDEAGLLQPGDFVEVHGWENRLVLLDGLLIPMKAQDIWRAVRDYYPDRPPREAIETAIATGLVSEEEGAALLSAAEDDS